MRVHFRQLRSAGFGRRVGVKLAVAAMVVASPLLGPPTPAQAASRHCSTHTISVRTTDLGPADATMWGELCYVGAQQPDTVQLLVHGGTYDHTYWDSPYGNGRYSYVRAATAVGYATFNVDRIGAGNSSHPSSGTLDVGAGAVALHDAITSLRSGSLSGQAFSRVIWVGHSFGSIHAWAEISRYHDVDALINTGLLHVLNQDFLNSTVFPAFYPAAADPRFAGSGLDNGYLTTQPGSRAALFYAPATTDPGVVALDEATKDTITAAQLGDLPAIFSLPPAQALTQQITVPVLVLNGQQDALHCGPNAADCRTSASVHQLESQFYPPQANLRTVIVPATGHDTALSTTAPLATAAMLAWSLSVVGL